MRLYKNLVTLLLMTGLLFTNLALAVDNLPSHLTALNSEQGTALLKRSANLGTGHMLQHFTTQETQTYCGVASAVMALNSLIVEDAPLMFPEDPKVDYQYFNQENFFSDAVLEIIDIDELLNNGMTLQQMADAIATFDGVRARPIFASDINLKQFRAIAREALAKGQYVTANFLRTGAGFEAGGGHHSPVVAYDVNTDQFLILDVARYRYPSFWISADDLWAGINTMDGNKSRGFIVIAKQS